MGSCCNNYTVTSQIPCAVLNRNLSSYFSLNFPSVYLNDAVIVSVDFSDQIGCTSRVVEAVFLFPWQSTPWQTIINNLPTALLVGIAPGSYTCQVSAKTDTGTTFQSMVNFTVSNNVTLVKPTYYSYAPNAFFAWGAVILDATSTPMILG